MPYDIARTLTLAQAGDGATDEGPPNPPQSGGEQLNQSQQTVQQTTEGAAGSAQTGQAQGTGTGTGTGGGGDPGGMGFIWFILPVVILVMFIFMGSSQRRERKKHEAMLAGLKKGDKVQTVGGILGTVVEMRDDEVLVKVDENANTRLRFSRNAIKTVTAQKEGESES